MTEFVKRDNRYLFFGRIGPEFGVIALRLNSDFVKVFATKHSRLDG